MRSRLMRPTAVFLTATALLLATSRPSAAAHRSSSGGGLGLGDINYGPSGGEVALAIGAIVAGVAALGGAVWYFFIRDSSSAAGDAPAGADVTGTAPAAAN